MRERLDISLAKFKILADAIEKTGIENKISTDELLSGLLQLVQCMLNRDDMIITFSGGKIEIK